MDKIHYNPKVFGTIVNYGSVISPTVDGVLVNEYAKMKPHVGGILSKDYEIHVNPQITGIYSPNTQIKGNLLLQAVIDQPKEKEFIVNGPKITMNVYRKNYEDRFLPIKMEVERVGKKWDEETTVIGYDTKVIPYVTYKFNHREYLKCIPYITYNTDGGINLENQMYVTYIDYTFGATNIERRYYACFYNEYMDKEIRCRLYDKTTGFPLRGTHLSVLCEDNHIRYCPLDLLGSDFDSGVRCSDQWGNQYQICMMRQENMINKFFPFGNMIIPLTTYNDLYIILTGIFGKARVQLGEDCIYFSPPSGASGLTKFLAIGLNIRITNCYGHTLTTYNNGLVTTSYGGDYNWTAKAMLLKWKNKEKFKIEFENSYHGTSYLEDAIVRNVLVIGQSIEALKEESASMELLVNNHQWYLFNVKRNEVNPVGDNNDYVKYFREHYLEYPKNKRTYNYYEIDKYKYHVPEVTL